MNIHEIVDFWTTPDGAASEGHTNEFIRKMKGEGFDDTVSPMLADAMMGWADAEPGIQAGWFASKAKGFLRICP